MSEKSKSSSTPKEAKPRQGAAKGTPDRWVDNKLRQLYDDIAAEPLPQDLLDLLNNIDIDPSKGGKQS